MCLSTVYYDKICDSSILMSNVTCVECVDNKIILTDLMERTVEIEGSLKKANLVDGYVIINSK